MTTTATHRPYLGVDQDQAYPLVLLSISPVGKSGCRHSFRLKLKWETTFCGLCFLQEGYKLEVPARLHLVKTLADNGNPQQTGKLESHLSVVEGIFPPGDMTLKEFSRARRHKGSVPACHIFPFASALWAVMGLQPPLGWPLYSAVRGIPEAQIANEMGISLYNVNDRLRKGVDMAARTVRDYDDERKRTAIKASAQAIGSDQEQDRPGRAKSPRARSK